MIKNKGELIKPCIIGLGYVGLPILVNLSKKYKTSGYDINKKRIFELKLIMTKLCKIGLAILVYIWQ